MINFSDIIKGKFLEEFSAISLGEMLVAIALSFVLSLFIVYIYRITYAGVNYSRSFVGTVMMLSMVTTVVILVISSNVVLSLGMVGALSIVRFRTAVKEATDTAFLFWAIATGIICGAGYVTIAILATLLLGLLFVGVHAFSKKQKFHSYMIVVRHVPDSRVEQVLCKLPAYRLKNKSLLSGSTELVAEVRLDDAAMKKLEGLRDDPEVMEISIMASVSGTAL
jgi:uncharacterized membrane protein YhiD involved in acid resistance